MKLDIWKSRTLEVALAPTILPDLIRNVVSVPNDEDENHKEEDKNSFILYTEKEEKSLELFREEIAKFPIEFQPETTNHFLIRWLRARDLNIRKATDMLRNYYEWKSTSELLPENWVDKTWQIPEIISTEFKYKFLGFDNLGRPVYWLPAGRYRPRSILSQGLIDDCFRYLYAAIDEVLQHCEEARINTNGKSTKATVLVDGACISWTQYSNFEVIQCGMRLANEYVSYFPELLGACYVVNAPYFYSFFYNLAVPLLPATTLSKIQIFNSNESKWKPVLQNAIPLDVLPTEYGGNAESVLNCYK